MVAFAAHTIVSVRSQADPITLSLPTTCTPKDEFTQVCTAQGFQGVSIVPTSQNTEREKMFRLTYDL